MARTHQHALGSKNVTELFAHNTYCYVKQLEVTYRCGLVVCSGVITVPRQLRTDKHISGNRGSGEVAKKRCISSYFDTGTKADGTPPGMGKFCCSCVFFCICVIACV
jgi:hypothetical protein